MADEPPTYRTFISSFTDFLTVAIHTILYEREIYPKTSFLSARKYNFAVRQNRHPKVCEWINDAVDSAENELLKCSVDRVAVVIYSKDNQPLERFMFDVSRFPVVPFAELDVPLERVNRDGEKEVLLPLVDIEEQFRATMNRLANCGSALEPLPKSCTFTVAIELKKESQAPLGHPQPWVPAQGQTESDARARKENRTTPIRAVKAGAMVFESWIEEVDRSPTTSFVSDT